ncbi:YrvL family regulatory protein [Clostridium sp. CCUG 7971]|uniref:YrvL family regulatory protein n=1 Tax=Clostridium sp. CCUG 7971 TaxID=2811414 RepID=UPI001ABA4AC4|nr:YrvL family regulatory protein [Clostridium sp. CCUG 7971]MBO3445103.1 hypothetical protein [Clostridium sp. CCUG 7971]
MSKNKHKIIVMSGIGLIIVSVLIMAIFDLGILSFFGFEHESIKSVIIFFVIYYILYFPVTLVSEAFTELIEEIKHLTPVQYKIFNFCMGMCINVAIVSLVDLAIKGVKIPFTTVFVFSILKHIMRRYISNFMDKKFGSSDDYEEDNDF